MRVIQGKFVALAMAVALLVGLFNLAVGTLQAQSSDASWNYAAEIAPQGLMEQIAVENLNPDAPVSLGRMRILPIASLDQQPLYLIDTRTASGAIHSESSNPLCGASGCTFLGYLTNKKKYQKVLDVYLDPHLPPNIHLIELTDKLHGGLPNLKINQLESDRLQQLTLSFNGQKYEVIDTQLFPQRYE